MTADEESAYGNGKTYALGVIGLLSCIPWGQMCSKLTGRNRAFYRAASWTDRLKLSLDVILFSIFWAIYFEISFTEIEFELILTESLARDIFLAKIPGLGLVIACNVFIFVSELLWTICDIYIGLSIYQRDLARVLCMLSIVSVTITTSVFVFGGGCRDCSGTMRSLMTYALASRGSHLLKMYDKIPWISEESAPAVEAHDANKRNN